MIAEGSVSHHQFWQLAASSELKRALVELDDGPQQPEHVRQASLRLDKEKPLPGSA